MKLDCGTTGGAGALWLTGSALVPTLCYNRLYLCFMVESSCALQWNVLYFTVFVSHS